MWKRLLAAVSLSVVLATVTGTCVTTPATAAPDTPTAAEQQATADTATAPERPAHSAITAPAYDVCAWVGVRDGYLGFGSASELVSWRRFWFIDHYWVECIVIIRASGRVTCVKYIISTHDGTTLHLGDTPCPH